MKIKVAVAIESQPAGTMDFKLYVVESTTDEIEKNVHLEEAEDLASMDGHIVWPKGKYGYCSFDEHAPAARLMKDEFWRK